MKSDSPPSMLRFSDFMRPPCILASTATPSEVAIIAPDSARTASPPAIVHRTTANEGVCLTWTSMRLLRIGFAAGYTGPQAVGHPRGHAQLSARALHGRAFPGDRGACTSARRALPL